MSDLCRTWYGVITEVMLIYRWLCPTYQYIVLANRRLFHTRKSKKLPFAKNIFPD